MRVLLIASSAREHAIADALSRSRHRPEIVAICPQKNPGLNKLSTTFHVENIMDFPRVLEIARTTKPDFAFIGPDDPIGAGLADELENIGVQSVAPKKSLAQIESSKGFARELLATYAIDASPKFRVFKNAGSIEEMRKNMNTFIDQLGGSYVVKYDALKGGKGVKVSGEHLTTVEEGLEYALACIEECGKVVIEEKLEGVEFSLLSFVSGTRVVDMPAVQDHKRAYDGDRGPNTGGMGTYTDSNHSLPFLDSTDLLRAKEINRSVAEALMKEFPKHAGGYRGILYGGYMAVRDGIRVIEFNARFGDPEALNILPLLTSDFGDVCTSIIEGTLDESLVSFAHKATVCNYIVPQSYPTAKNERGKGVSFPSPRSSSPASSSHIYFGDVTEKDDGSLALGGSRSAGIVAVAESIEEARKMALDLCAKVQGPVRYRTDIATPSLLKARVDLLRRLRHAH
jgi:phosphoribosylamine--glycine ligase